MSLKHTSKKQLCIALRDARTLERNIQEYSIINVNKLKALIRLLHFPYLSNSECGILAMQYLFGQQRILKKSQTKEMLRCIIRGYFAELTFLFSLYQIT